MAVIAALGFEPQMRIGSLAVTAALAIAALLAARPRVRAATEIGRVTPMQLQLEIFERGASHSYDGRPPFDVGRDRSADLILRDPEVSRRHARFESHEGIVYVDDLRSSNGTFLNGRRVIESIEVRPGDEIDVGTTRIVVRSIRPG